MALRKTVLVERANLPREKTIPSSIYFTRSLIMGRATMVIILAFMLTRLLNIILSSPVTVINGINNDSRRDMIIGLTFMLISWRERCLDISVRIYLLS